MKKQHIKAKITLSNIIHYFTGNYRYKLYYWIEDENSNIFLYLLAIILMRVYIYEQITWRITVMDQECYEMGSCKLCGCQTTALQMSNKSCDKPCYPPMMNKQTWYEFKKLKNII